MFNIANAQLLGGRESQQDYFATYSFEETELCVLADGMGGYKGGEVASAIVVKSILEVLKSCEGEMHNCLEEALFKSNEALKDTIIMQPELDGMGTTLVAVLFTRELLVWLNVGDSILYRIRDGEIQRLNADHSIGGELDAKAKEGLISTEEAENHPERHHLTSALAGHEIEHYEINSSSIEEGDTYIIASDGLHTLHEDEITQICTHYETVQHKADALIERVDGYQKNHQDNTTLIIVEGVK